MIRERHGNYRSEPDRRTACAQELRHVHAKATSPPAMVWIDHARHDRHRSIPELDRSATAAARRCTSMHRRATSTTSRARMRAASYESMAGGPRTEIDEHCSAHGVTRSVGPSTNPAVEAASASIPHESGSSTLVSSTAALASRVTGMCRRSECSDTSSADVRLARSSSYLCAASCSEGRPSSTRATAVTNRNQRARVLRKAAAQYQTGPCAASDVSVRRTARTECSARFCS